jgi:hypothetical protein
MRKIQESLFMRRGLAVRVLRVARWLILVLAVALASGPARADNDYYDNVQGGAAGKSAAPRLALQNGDVELVAVARTAARSTMPRSTSPRARKRCAPCRSKAASML